MKKVLFGDIITNSELEITYRQQHMGHSFDDINFDDNFVCHSLEDVFDRAMNSALNRFYQGNLKFIPVAQAKVSGEYIGCIGMIRFYNGDFEFSGFETGNRDFRVRSKNANWRLNAIAVVNRELEKNELYPYYYNLTSVKYDCDGTRGCGKHFAKAVLTFLNAFSSFHIEQLPSQKNPDHISKITIVRDENTESENVYATFTNKERYNVEEALINACKHQGASISIHTISCD